MYPELQLQLNEEPDAVHFPCIHGFGEQGFCTMGANKQVRLT